MKTTRGNSTVVLLTCGAIKAARENAPHPDGFLPEELYLGTFFKQELRYARSVGLTWAVVGLKYGVIPNTQRLMPYDLLPPKRIDVPTWRVLVHEQLTRLGATRALFVTNWAYFEPFVGVPGVRWAFDEMKKQGIGWRMQWLAENRGKVPTISGVLPRVIEPGPIRYSVGGNKARRAQRTPRQEQAFILEEDA